MNNCSPPFSIFLSNLIKKEKKLILCMYQNGKRRIWLKHFFLLLQKLLNLIGCAPLNFFLHNFLIIFIVIYLSNRLI